MLIACVPGCAAHFEPDSDPDWDEGFVPNRYENSILSWVSLLPGSNEVVLRPDLEPFNPAWMKVYANSAFFEDVDGRQVPCWIVLTYPNGARRHRAVAFTSRSHPAAYVADLLRPGS